MREFDDLHGSVGAKVLPRTANPTGKCMEGIVDVYWPIVIERPELSVYFVSVVLVVGIVAMNLVSGVIINSAIEQAMENKAVVAEGKCLHGVVSCGLLQPLQYFPEEALLSRYV